MIPSFQFARLPRIFFGSKMFEKLPGLAAEYGRNVLLLTGGASHKASGRYERLQCLFSGEGLKCFHASVKGEPSPDLVDELTNEHRNKDIDVVIGWGGGSVVDAGKAVSAMLKLDASVCQYLEGVGRGVEHPGCKVPYIAVPTTAGTGSEATKNAVLSRISADGFKKSLRHDNFVPDVAVVDPDLMLSCPSHITASCGLDAFVQLLESYVSKNASTMTDALAFSGLEAVSDHLVEACTEGGTNKNARAAMAYGAMVSGMTLANAGLGVVHGLAGPIGGFFNIPHGVACGTLIGVATKATCRKLLTEYGTDHPALLKYAEVGAMLAESLETDVETGCRLLTEKIDEWVERMRIPRLGEYGIMEKDFSRIVAGAGNKNNPVAFSKDEMRELLLARL